jgi:hypothetical protein
MTRKTHLALVILVALVVFVASSCAISETSWARKENAPDNLRSTVGLSSLAIGNLSPAARNPGLEGFCTGLYDVPGGYCSYFTPGAVAPYSMATANITVGEYR